ncbi:BRO family protein [Desulfobotulus sp. H1]|uniref:BRO family protein n=1 Tax=Desulfobotulus pelophilus TaxID=2823377 RepID=A0ABT3NCP3_9BACT|nr:BRO family protein [Desulfobotulus pelophilus]MCW7755240.1 BRO family protein [Desulfobotulus pelophilus]
MTQHLSITDFTFQNHTVRTLSENEETWFVARDVCDAMDIAWKGSDSLQSIPESWRVVRSFRTTLKNQHGEYGEQEKEFILINEPALYKLAFRSNKPAAEEFTNWVASEVLPAIRKTGRYGSVAPVDINHGHEDQILLARHLVREVNGMLASLRTVGQLHQNMVVSVNNILRTVSVLSPEVHHEAFLQTLRQQKEKSGGVQA